MRGAREGEVAWKEGDGDQHKTEGKELLLCRIL